MEKRKLLFVSANRFANPYPVYPIGISYLYSYLKERLPGFEIRTFDFNLYSMEEFVAYLRKFRPDYTGVSFRNIDDVNSLTKEWFVRDYQEIMDSIKRTIDTRIIIGGSAFSIYPGELFSMLRPEFGICGEGEESLYRLLLALEGNSDFRQIEGLVYSNGTGIVINERKEFLKSLNLCFDSGLVQYYWDKSGMMNLQTKRGCPYKCIYCTYPLIEGSRIRTLDPEQIVKTLSDLVRQKNVNYVFFTDSVFNISNKFNAELAERMIRAKLEIKWGAYFSPHNLDRELLQLFGKAGLTHIEFGTESLSDRTLKKYGKHFTVDDIVRVSESCREEGIYFAHFMILGGYGETEETIDEGFENCKRIEDTVFFPYIGMRIYPGTPLQKLAVEEGYLDPEESLLEPVYYLADGINYETLRERADRTGRRWVFPDEDVATVMKRLRKRNRKGSLWHHLKK